ncbi:testis-specific gene 10 protein isoform X2 [Engraulis encrasicolus]
MRARTVRNSNSSSTKVVTAQSILNRVEVERDEAQADLTRMTTERDSLRERLKIAQETAIGERAHLEQRVEDLQRAILTLEQERGEQRSRQASLKESMMDLEQEVQALGRQLSSAADELSGYKNECSMLRLAHNQAESNLSESQRRLTSRIAELHKAQERNKMLDEENESLLKQLSGVREDMCGLQNSITDQQQQKISLQDQLDKKSMQLTMANTKLDDNERTIRSLRVNIEELDTTIRGLRESVSSKDYELSHVRKKLTDSEEELTSTQKVKEATARDNGHLRDELDQARVENKALHLKVEECSVEMENLKRRVEDYTNDVARIEDLLAAKERECRDLQECRRRVSVEAESWESQARQAETTSSQLRMELVTADLERQRLKEKLHITENSLQEALCGERESSGQLSQVNRRLLEVEEELREAQKQQSRANADLDTTRQLCVKLDISKETLERELEASQSELGVLRKQLHGERASARTLEAMLVSTRDKDQQREAISHERTAELHKLRDQLSAADNKATTQSREMALLRNRALELGSDLEITKKQLSAERFDRERAVQELRRQGLCSTLSSALSSSLRPSSPSRRSLSPQRPWSPDKAPYHTSPEHRDKAPYHTSPEHRSPRRSSLFRDLYD